MKDEGAKSLANALSNMPKLKYLVLLLGSTDIGINGAKVLAKAIKKLSELEKLTLEMFRNYVMDLGAGALMESIAYLSKLKSLHLNLATNGISMFGIGRILQTLKNMNINELFIAIGGNQDPDELSPVMETFKKEMEEKGVKITVDSLY